MVMCKWMHPICPGGILPLHSSSCPSSAHRGAGLSPSAGGRAQQAALW